MWMYYKPIKRDVFVAKIDLPYFDEQNDDRLECDVFFWNTKEKKWDVGSFSDFTPPKEQH